MDGQVVDQTRQRVKRGWSCIDGGDPSTSYYVATRVQVFVDKGDSEVGWEMHCFDTNTKCMMWSRVRGVDRFLGEREKVQRETHFKHKLMCHHTCTGR